jgi:hypothetical protein
MILYTYEATSLMIEEERSKNDEEDLQERYKNPVFPCLDD